MTQPPDDFALALASSVVELARWLIDCRDNPADTDSQPQLRGYRMRTKDGRVVSSARAMERVRFSKECRDLVNSGVDFATLVPWLNQQILDDMMAAAEATFLDVDGILTATELHEWVDAQHDDKDDEDDA